MGAKISFKKGTKDKTNFGTRLFRLSGVQESPKQKISVRDRKGKVVGNIFNKRKRGISFPCESINMAISHRPLLLHKCFSYEQSKGKNNDSEGFLSCSAYVFLGFLWKRRCRRGR